MLSALLILLKTRPTMRPPLTAGPPLLPGFKAASIWILNPPVM